MLSNGMNVATTIEYEMWKCQISYQTKVSKSERSSSDDDTPLAPACKDNTLHIKTISNMVLLLSPCYEVEWGKLYSTNSLVFKC